MNKVYNIVESSYEVKTGLFESFVKTFENRKDALKYLSASVKELQDNYKDLAVNQVTDDKVNYFEPNIILHGAIELLVSYVH
jgi:hypothetical protein